MIDIITIYEGVILNANFNSSAVVSVYVALVWGMGVAVLVISVMVLTVVCLGVVEARLHLGVLVCGVFAVCVLSAVGAQKGVHLLVTFVVSGILVGCVTSASMLVSVYVPEILGFVPFPGLCGVLDGCVYALGSVFVLCTRA